MTLTTPPREPSQSVHPLDHVRMADILLEGNVLDFPMHPPRDHPSASLAYSFLATPCK